MILLFVLIFFDNKSDENRSVENKENRAIFISYIELSKYIKNSNIDISKQNIKTMIKNIKNLGFNMIILQVRSFSDSIYDSNIYPWSSAISTSEGVSPGYDVLKYFIKETHKENMHLHAWINPYRVRGVEDVSTITDSNPAFKYIDTDTLYVGGGIYYNPAKEEVIDLIVSGVLELVSNYEVDGILLDDYFYPNSDIDVNDYNKYISQNEYLSIEEFRINNINKMVKRVYNVCKKHKKLFGISPDGNIDNNYSKNYADVKTWGSTRGYVDYLMPQIYYGFYNETKAFKKVLEEWSDLVTCSEVDLMIALAFYKVGLVDTYAKSGENEWLDNNDIIMREIIMSRNIKKYNGFALFRYDYLFNTNLQTMTTMKEIENMLQILN